MYIHPTQNRNFVTSEGLEPPVLGSGIPGSAKWIGKTVFKIKPEFVGKIPGMAVQRPTKQPPDATGQSRTHVKDDSWSRVGNVLKRIHNKTRMILFNPRNSIDIPIRMSEIGPNRVTEVQYEDGT